MALYGASDTLDPPTSSTVELSTSHTHDAPPMTLATVAGSRHNAATGVDGHEMSARQIAHGGRSAHGRLRDEASIVRDGTSQASPGEDQGRHRSRDRSTRGGAASLLRRVGSLS